MSTELSVVQLFLHASWLVKGIMVGLLMVSMVSWTVIFQRWFSLRAAEQAMQRFENQFWSGMDLTVLYEQLGTRRGALSWGEQVFQSGFREFVRLRKQVHAVPDAVMEGTQRAMWIAATEAEKTLSQHISFLATVASVSPYVGLFGTVWGIMHAFMALGGVQQATLAMVAPGIAEALVATAMGLFVAIPAVVAYNRFSEWSGQLIGRLESFQEAFTGILHRQAYATVVPVGS